jgi:hypothetical protein
MLPYPFAALLALVLFAIPLAAQSSPDRGRKLVDGLIDRIVAGEQQFVDRMGDYQPLMETYIQAMPEDPPDQQSTAGDQYLLGTVSLDDDGVAWTSFAESRGFQEPTKFFFFSLGKKGFRPIGFAQMIVPDSFSFNRDTYAFDYLRREFLGEVRTLVFDVRPVADPKGRFLGRIWVEDRDYRIVRFNGAYSGGTSSEAYFHFDSWRVNVEQDLWVPAFIYVQDEDITGRVGARFKAQSRLWNYNRVEDNRLDELASILIEAEISVDESAARQDPAPLESERMWRRQARENVLERLERGGLLAPKGEVDQVLNTVVNNLLVSNDIDLEVQCRVLLTTPLETFSIGQAIVISRGLIDVLPDEAGLAAVLADELAHIVLGHRMETMYAFSDQMIFNDDEMLNRLRLRHEPDELEQAGAKALEMLLKSPYKDQLAGAGLFFQALRERAPILRNLIDGNLGNELASSDALLRLSTVAERAPELDDERVDQIAALPLGSRVKFDPWTNQVSLIQAKPVALRSARDKLAFEVTPFMPYLTRWTSPPDPALAAQSGP